LTAASTCLLTVSVALLIASLDEQQPDHIYTPIETVTIYFLKDLIMGKKRRIWDKDVRHIAIP